MKLFELKNGNLKGASKDIIKEVAKYHSDMRYGDIKRAAINFVLILIWSLFTALMIKLSELFGQHQTK